MKIKKLQYIVFLADKTVSIPGQKDLFLITLNRKKSLALCLFQEQISMTNCKFLLDIITEPYDLKIIPIIKIHVKAMKLSS